MTDDKAKELAVDLVCEYIKAKCSFSSNDSDSCSAEEVVKLLEGTIKVLEGKDPDDLKGIF